MSKNEKFLMFRESLIYLIIQYFLIKILHRNLLVSVAIEGRRSEYVQCEKSTAGDAHKGLCIVDIVEF